MKIQHSRCWQIAAAALILLGCAAHAQTVNNPYAKGPNPTDAILDAPAGPFSVATTNVYVTQAAGFGGGTIYYPTLGGKYAVLAICPGYTATSSSIAALARRIATHGFVVIAINTLTTLDQPASRATQLQAALRYTINDSISAVRSRVDGNRRGVAGHSMGGGGALIAAMNDPSLKAVIALTPWATTTFVNLRVPNFIVGADGDTVAPIIQHATPFYDGIAQAEKAYMVLNNATNLTPIQNNPPTNRYSVSWSKRFLDDDTRYNPFLCGAPHEAYLLKNRALIESYRSTCPY
jgi:predicted dienelactone hydrolase